MWFVKLIGAVASFHCNMTKTLMLLFLMGVLCSDYEVDYLKESICAAKGSSVIINCTFRYPTERVEDVMWGHERSDIFNGPFIYQNTLMPNSSKFEYIGDKESNCSLKIHQVESTDKGKYTFRFVTTADKWTGQSGSTINVVDLNIVLNHNQTLTEGRSVTLTCIAISIRHNSSAFIWFKNGKRVHEGAVLQLNNMSHTNSGNYTCSSKMCVGTSGIKRIDVEYGPKNTSASIISVMSSNITLVCSSHANPPVEAYTWFKTAGGGSLVVAHQSVFSPADGGQYFCSVTSKHGSQNSSIVKVEMKASWTAFPRYVRCVLIITPVALLLILITVIASIRCYKKRRFTSKIECEEDVQDPIYANCPVFNNNQTQENNEENLEIVYATVNFDTKRKTHMEQQMTSHDDDDIIYSVVCR
ncbi:B-cell receptor CD22-like isoform X2 [Sphaeramia orbicularis]|nr:B-cell receptor CD22-like isoform X2 [Sphaeramia orbicularis]